MKAQGDSQPMGGDSPTSIRGEGEVIEDEHFLPFLPEERGKYRVAVGIYDLESMERLAAFDSKRQCSDSAVLEARRDETQMHIGKLSSQLLASKGYELSPSADDPISRLITRYSQEQLEREQARKRELTQARDLAWETYQTLSRKEAEVRIATQATDTEVRFAACRGA